MTSHQMKILVIDDEKICADDLADFLSSLKYEVDKAYSALSADVRLRAKKYDLVITDVNMPKKDGITLAREIMTTFPQTGIILISGKAEIIESINALELGVIDFLPKPVNVEKLASLIKNCQRPYK